MRRQLAAGLIGQSDDFADDYSFIRHPGFNKEVPETQLRKHSSRLKCGECAAVEARGPSAHPARRPADQADAETPLTVRFRRRSIASSPTANTTIAAAKYVRLSNRAPAIA